MPDCYSADDWSRSYLLPAHVATNIPHRASEGALRRYPLRRPGPDTWSIHIDHTHLTTEDRRLPPSCRPGRPESSPAGSSPAVDKP
ncbi:MAG: hypothetical protein ACRDRL_22335 [Sciscionella sp.]